MAERNRIFPNAGGHAALCAWMREDVFPALGLSVGEAAHRICPGCIGGVIL